MNRQLKNAINRFPFLKNRLRTVYSYIIHIYKEKKKYSKNIKSLSKVVENKRICFLVLTPAHGNIGDHAITAAELDLLKQNGIEYYEIPGKQLVYLEKQGKLSLLNGHPIMVNGGGFLGTLWYHNERVLRNLILSNPDSEILFFPDSVYYDNSDRGREELKKAKEIYHSHRHLKVYLRERVSFQLMKDICDNVALAPDMVMLLHRDSVSERTGCLLCLRNDREKTMTDEMTASVTEQAGALFDNVESIDTVMPYSIPIAKRNAEIDKLLDRIRKAELVITDRLHGMIFSAITGTPCIVINSKSHKIQGCYEWLKHLDYIKLCSDVTAITELYYTMPHGSQKYDNKELLPYYEELLCDLKRMGEKNGKPAAGFNRYSSL